jgi:hypothetical protein
MGVKLGLILRVLGKKVLRRIYGGMIKIQLNPVPSRGGT